MLVALAWIAPVPGLEPPLCAAPQTSPRPAEARLEEEAALRDLRRWMTPFRNPRRELSARETHELSRLLGNLRFRAPTPSPRLIDTLVELSALGWEEHLHEGNLRDWREFMTRSSLQELERRLEGQPEVARYLGSEHLGEKPRFPHSHEVVCTLLVGRYLEPTVLGLLEVAEHGAEPAAALAQKALSGWSRPDVNHFFLEGLEARRLPSSAVARHFQALEVIPEADHAELLAVFGKLLVSGDWRDAIRAGRLVPTVEPRRAVPILIEALALWDRRQASGQSSKRVRHEITEALRAISGRSLGPDVSAWNRWWSAVLEGRIPLVSERIAAGEAPTAASFFGLRPVSDRVAFLIDRSGSMRNRFGTGPHSRHAEAIDQALRFLETSGVETRFSLTVFSDAGRAETWRNKLLRADEKNLRAAERWLTRKEPEGATLLFPGLARCLRLGRGGALEPGRIEVDTVIVLCDGETEEGPAWVEPWIRKHNEKAQLVFHCVQVGHRGDGTLERLAELTGGQFLRVEG